MAEATLIEARHSTRQEIESLCLDLARGFTSSLGGNDLAPFGATLQQLSDWPEGHGEDAYAWHAALSTLRSGLSDLLPLLPGVELATADSLLDRARLAIAEQVQRQATDALLQHMEMANRLGLMTSQLLATNSEHSRQKATACPSVLQVLYPLDSGGGRRIEAMSKAVGPHCLATNYGQNCQPCRLWYNEHGLVKTGTLRA